MASVFTHAFVAGTCASIYPKRNLPLKFWLLGMFCSVIPDADVIGFDFGIHYGDPWGHRGASHSIVFAIGLAFLIMLVAFREIKFNSKQWWGFWSYFFLCTISHGILDAITNGGEGVGFFFPFDNTRYFFPWRPILVSPLGASNFFSDWGWKVVLSEWKTIWKPGLLVLLPALLMRLQNKKKK